MTAPPAERVRLSVPGATAVVESTGGSISSLRVGPTSVELLARTPWADATDDGWRMESSSSEWHRRYPGGWHVLVPRALGPARVDGVDHPFHGEAAWRTWALSTTGPATCTATVLLRSVPLRIERTVSLESDGRSWAVVVDQTISDLGGDGARIGWVEHPALRGNLFDGSTITVGGADDVAVESVGGSRFVDSPAPAGTVTLTSDSAALTVEIRTDPSVFPRVYVWQERRATRGFPWYRLVDVIGIEPASQRHDVPSDALGDLRIPPGGSISSSVRMYIHPLPTSPRGSE